MRATLLPFLGALLLSPALAACSGADGNMSNPEGMGDHGGPPSAARPRLYVRIAAEQTPVAIAKGIAHETPADQRLGVLGLQLLRSEDDAHPLVVFEAQTPVDTGCNDGDETLVGQAVVSELTAGTFLFARVPVAYARFTVAGRYHAEGMTMDGHLSDTVSLSEETLLMGEQRDQGWFSDTFLAAGMPQTTETGEGSELGQPARASGIRLDTSQPAGAYVFPVQVVVDPTVSHDVTLRFVLDTYEDFHWQDQTDEGYASDVFDVSGEAFEPVTQAGANGATVTMQ